MFRTLQFRANDVYLVRNFGKQLDRKQKTFSNDVISKCCDEFFELLSCTIDKIDEAEITDLFQVMWDHNLLSSKTENCS